MSNSHKRPLSNSSFSVTFLGVRGTGTTPFPGFLKYGGNTPCIEITSVFKDSKISLLFDAGTGIIHYAEKALAQGMRVFHLFLSHMHYDHIMGLTQFAPLFRNDCEINIYGCAKGNMSLRQIFQEFFKFPFFPIEFNQLPSLKNLKFFELNSNNTIHISHIRVDNLALNHPQDSCAYRIWNHNESKHIVYATDHEHGSSKDDDLKSFIRNSEIFIYDSTFTDQEYANYKGWGHSTSEYGAQLASECGVKKFAIFHHSPIHSDRDLEKLILPEAKKIFKNSFLAKENFTIKIKN